jgi:hypothetical protein
VNIVDGKEGDNGKKTHRKIPDGFSMGITLIHK